MANKDTNAAAETGKVLFLMAAGSIFGPVGLMVGMGVGLGNAAYNSYKSEDVYGKRNGLVHAGVQAVKDLFSGKDKEQNKEPDIEKQDITSNKPTANEADKEQEKQKLSAQQLEETKLLQQKLATSEPIKASKDQPTKLASEKDGAKKTKAETPQALIDAYKSEFKGDESKTNRSTADKDGTLSFNNNDEAAKFMEKQAKGDPKGNPLVKPQAFYMSDPKTNFAVYSDGKDPPNFKSGTRKEVYEFAKEHPREKTSEQEKTQISDKGDVSELASQSSDGVSMQKAQEQTAKIGQ